MPWSHLSPLDQRTQFIADYLRRGLSVTELCEHYGISRKSGYKWIECYEREGPAGLAERSRRPQVCPTQTLEEVVRPFIRSARAPSLLGREEALWCSFPGAIAMGLGRLAPPSATSSIATA